MQHNRTQAKTSSELVEAILGNLKTWDHLPIDIEVLNNSDWVRKGNKKTKYCNYPVSFDIETSSFYQGEDKAVTMYIWQMAIGDNVYIGRTWQEFMQFNMLLHDGLNLSEDRRLVVYVHSLAYEFQFMRLWYDWIDVFALDERKVCKACSSIGIEYRCSYILTNESLASVAKHLKKPMEKLKGDLDYQLIRGSCTDLEPHELAYCVQDVLIITEFIREQIEIEGNITKIPNTKTGYVRRYCKQKCLYGDSPDKYDRIDNFMRYGKMMGKLTLTKHEYLMLKRAFAGGFVHASIFYVNRVIDNVQSQDLTSSYPTTCVAELFPMSKGKLVHPKDEDEFKYYIGKFCCVFDVKIYGLSNIFHYEAVISQSKCWDIKNPIVNNGRLESADMIGITLTEQDYYTYSLFYSWDHIEVGDMYIYRRGYLPEPFISSILNFYKNKTVLKGVTDEDGHELVEYSQSKAMLNSTYGMIVTDICKPTITYTGMWDMIVPDYEQAIDDYNNSKGRFLYFPWGVWVTSHSRRNILNTIYHLKEDYIYSDTDSVKYLHPERHQAYFDEYNRIIIEKLKKAMRYHGLPEDMIEPCNQNGKPKPMGVFTDEGQYKHFKTLGAKRYMYTTDTGTYITVAGLGKDQGAAYINSQPDPYEFFSNDMYIPAEHTGKLTHTYIDDTMMGQAIDYQGHKFDYLERSGVHLSPCDFSLSLTWQFLKMIDGLKDVEVL